MSLLWRQRSSGSRLQSFEGQCSKGLSSLHFGPGLGPDFPQGTQVGTQVKKRLSNPPDPAQTEGCVESLRVPERVTRLNTSTLLNPDSLFVNINFLYVKDLVIRALVDSGSTHCFIDKSFVMSNSLVTEPILSIALKLFDGSSSSTISSVCTLMIQFPCGLTYEVTFFVTQLDPSCSVVLGHNWLTRYNPLIDWVLGSISFRTSPDPDLVSTSPSARAVTAIPPPPEPEIMAPENKVPPSISIINAVAFVRACKMEGTQCFSIDLSEDGASGRSSRPTPVAPEDLSAIPEKYHSFADVFSKQKASKLPPHQPCDLKLNTDEGATPPLGPI